MMSEKLTILSPRYDFPSPRSIRTNNIVKHLINDFPVSVICFTNGENELANTKFGESIYRLPLTTRSKYITNRTFSGYKPWGGLKYLLGALNLVIKKVFLFPDEWILESEKTLKTLLNIEPDIVIASMHPFSMGEMALSYKKQTNAKVVFDIGDPLAFNAAVRNYSRRKASYEKELLHKADHLIVTNEQTKAHYVKQYGLAGEKISIIPQGIDLDTFQNTEVSKTDSKLSMIYAGAFYPELRDPRLFFEELKNYEDQFNIEVYGKHLSMFRVKQKNISFYGRISQQELSGKYNASDVLLFFDNKEGIQSSGKIFELLALKKPVVFIYDNEDSYAKEIASSYEHIFFIKNNKGDIKRGLKELMSFLKQDFNMSYDINQFSWSVKADQFKQILNGLGK